MKGQIVHIRIKRYVAMYMKHMYGCDKDALLWPKYHAATLIMENTLVQDEDTTTIPHLCITDYTWQMCKEQVDRQKKGNSTRSLFDHEHKLQGNTKLLTDWDTESRYYFDVELPERGIRRGGFIEPNCFTKVSAKGISYLNEALTSEFYMDLFTFYQEEVYLAAQRQHRITIKDIVENFCSLHDIPMGDDLDTLIRKFRMVRDEVTQKIENRRNRINPDEAPFLKQGKPRNRKQKEDMPLFGYGAAFLNMVEDPGQARGV